MPSIGSIGTGSSSSQLLALLGQPEEILRGTEGPQLAGSLASDEWWRYGSMIYLIRNDVVMWIDVYHGPRGRGSSTGATVSAKSGGIQPPVSRARDPITDKQLEEIRLLGDAFAAIREEKARAAKARRDKNRMRMLIAAAIVVPLAVLALGWWGWSSWRKSPAVTHAFVAPLHGPTELVLESGLGRTVFAVSGDVQIWIVSLKFTDSVERDMSIAHAEQSAALVWEDGTRRNLRVQSFFRNIAGESSKADFWLAAVTTTEHSGDAPSQLQLGTQIFSCRAVPLSEFEDYWRNDPTWR